MGNFIEYFDPSGKEFKFNFTKSTCPKLNTGVCDLQNFLTNDSKATNFKYTKCQNILIGLMNGKINSIKMIPYIHKCTCGHWICTDGQHRICVAQKRGLTLKVEREDCNEECFECHQHKVGKIIKIIEIKGNKLLSDRNN